MTTLILLGLLPTWNYMHKWRICPNFQLKAISYYGIHLSNSPALCIMLEYSPHENGTSTPELPLTELQFKNCSKLKLGVLAINIEFTPVIFWYAQIQTARIYFSEKKIFWGLRGTLSPTSAHAQTS